MDKRTVIFIFLVGATFFGLNFFFSQQRDAKNREFLQQQEAKKLQLSAQAREELSKRTAKIQDLPIVEISSEQQTRSYGVDLGNSTLTLAWNAKVPNSVSINGKEQNLLSADYVKNGPVLFGSSAFKALPIAAVPGEGVFDVQVITFPQGEQPRIYLGEFREGTLTFPLSAPSLNGIGLLKTEDGWLPIGFYEAQGNIFVEMQNLPSLTGLTQAYQSASETTQPTSEQFFLLENDYVQLLFSNVGGALVEINLPFNSETNTHSVVNEIGFDREIAKDYPANARFPAHPYYTSDSKELHQPEKIGGYYPLIRRGIWNKKTTEISPQYYALNIVSEYPEMAELRFRVKEFTNSKIVFEANQPHRKLTKTYTLVPGSEGPPYAFDLDIQIEGDSRGLWLTSGVPEVEIMSNNSSPQIQYRITRKGKSEVEKLDLPKPKEVVTVSSVYPDWVVNSNGYLGIILDPLTEVGSGYRASAIAGNQIPTRLSVIDPQYNPYPSSKYPGYQVLLPIPNKGGTMKLRIYSGPFEESVLKAVDKIYSNAETGYTPDYIACRTFYGWFSFISEPFAKLLFIVMDFFHRFTGSWGFSIILLTLFLRVLLYPLNAWSIKSMRRMQALSPQIQAIQQRHKKDPKKSQIEIMALYRENKVNPFTGCIPVLIQIPFLIGMFDLLKSSFQLRGASFIPGWIDNLTAPDVLFQWKQPIFFIGNQFHLLPILLGVVMFIQQRFFSAGPKNPDQMTDQQRQQRAMGTMMTIVFAVMFYHFPSGLNIYWLSSMLLGILQQWITNKVLDKKKSEIEILPAPKKKLDPKKGGAK